MAFGLSFAHPWALLALLLPFIWLAWDRLRRRPTRAMSREPRSTREWLRLFRPTIYEWFRLLIITLLILALAGTGMVFSARNQAVMFVADVSSSTATVRSEMETFIKKAIGEMAPGDVAGVLAIGEDAQLEAPVSARPTFAGFTAIVRPDHTDLERGLRLGAALLPVGYRPRIVLLSDGKENVGNAMAEVQRLRQRGFTVDVLNMAPKPGPEALIKTIEAPGTLRQGEKLDLAITITSSAETTAQLRIYQERTLLETRTIPLRPGDQQVRVSMENLPSGYHRLWATLEAEQDTLTQNNESAVLVNIQGAPSILVVEGLPGSATNIVQALRAAGMQVEVRPPDALPTHGPQYARYASVVMVDVPAPLMRSTSLDAIEGYVKQSGHGLVVIGGENSYAMGGYGGTPLEELLPVSMDVPQRREQPPVAVALIIENFESQQKVNISKEAGKALVDMLTPRDTILVGDATLVGGWAVPPQKVTDKGQIKALIDAMAPGDPPHYMDHLEAAAAALNRIDAKIKHIVFAGDGDAQMITFNEYAQRVARIADMGITVSTIHVNWLNPGEEVLMQLIAQVGGGRYYLASDPAATPQIFMKEAQSMARPGVVEEDFFPTLLSPSPIMTGIDAFPLLRGYIATTPKTTGEVILQSAQADPILAAWQTGLGRVVAFTSDSGGLWTEEMVPWEGFTRFWSNAVSWTMPAVDDQGMRTMASVVGGKAHLTVQLPGEGLEIGGVGGPNSWPASITAGIIRPDGSTQVMPLQGTAPGQYEGEIPASIPGPYLVKLAAGTKRQSTTLGETFVVVPYSPEFASSGADPGFMERLAKAGGGKVLLDPAMAFAWDLPPAPGRLPLDQILLVLALILWPLEIAMRRLSLTPAEIGDAIRRRRERRQLSGMATSTSAALGKIRERRAETLPPARPAASEGTEPEARVLARPPKAEPKAQAQASQPKAQAPAKGEEPKPDEEAGSFSSRLLAAKRKRQ